nr:MAG TPA: hypothetical protein [Caudoviricetes sp.]
MSDYTKHLRLIKPAGNEYYNVDHFNHNAELIDKETEDLSNKVTEIQQGATREKAGIVQFGTEEGKALEGMMLARLAGCVGYGGDIQEPGVKDINYIYYDRNTRKMYKCLNQNSDVSANVANFIPLDNNSLLDRLENLSKVTILKKSDVDREFLKYFGLIQIIKIGKLVIFSGVINQVLNNAINTSGTIIGNLPYRPSEEIWVDPGFTIKNNGNVMVGAFLGISQKKIEAQQHISFSYIAGA